MTDSFIEKTILDRNGIPKVIKLKIAGEQGIVKRPKWRGLEFGWTSNDVTPEDKNSYLRQLMQDWVINHNGEVLARNVKIGHTYIPLVYRKNSEIFFITIGDKDTEIPYSLWLNAANESASEVFEHNVHFDENSKRHAFKLLSQPIANMEQ